MRLDSVLGVLVREVHQAPEALPAVLQREDLQRSRVGFVSVQPHRFPTQIPGQQLMVVPIPALRTTPGWAAVPLNVVQPERNLPLYHPLQNTSAEDVG